MCGKLPPLFNLQQQGWVRDFAALVRPFFSFPNSSQIFLPVKIKECPFYELKIEANLQKHCCSFK
jgi:hypothetical protein